eukprot:EC692327.1.p1 GENE.EC692327.1~~EC692327.1.p1  ORF type:complete len:208 (+),score=93.63 EC692327.1:66-626(+)
MRAVGHGAPLLCGSSVAVRALSFNFQTVAEKLTTPKGREELGRLMKTRDELNKMIRNDTKPVSVDFDHYRKVIQTEGLVDAFQSALSNAKLPEIQDTFTAEAEAVFTELIAQAKALSDESTSRVNELQGLLDNLRARKDISEITIEEALAEDPKLAAEINQEIEEERWAILESDSNNAASAKDDHH